jgi:hypothetical protein
VAIALGASAITGIATAVAAFLGTSLRARHEREEQWSDRLVRAADDFATAGGKAHLAVNETILYAQTRVNFEPLAIEADRRIREAHAHVGRVNLLFGVSDTSLAANRLLTNRRSALTELRDRGISDREEGIDMATQALDDAEDHLDRFYASALERIGPPGPTRPRDRPESN